MSHPPGRKVEKSIAVLPFDNLSLKAKLSPGEKAQIERKPTENAQAYLLYLQARDYVQRPDELMDDMLKAE